MAKIQSNDRFGFKEKEPQSIWTAALFIMIRKKLLLLFLNSQFI